EIIDKLKRKEFYNTLVLIRVFGTLESGKTTDIDWKKIYSFLESAYFVMKNTNGLTTKEYEEIKIENTNAEEVESNLIEQQPVFKNLTKEKQTKLIKNMMLALSSEKKDGEKVYQYEARIKEEMEKLIES
ncbi:MAG: hypothetical protein QXR96_01920, partial [Candidatus Woesearchaeota archaeon]